jgi:Zn-dependent protease
MKMIVSSTPIVIGNAHLFQLSDFGLVHEKEIMDTSFMEPTQIQYITVMAIPLLFAITLHEVAHGWVASFCGDQTARLSGRLTINPIKHIDLIGTIIVPILCLVMGGFIFGWAKPVPVDPRNMNKPRRDMALVALAGPLSNIVMAILWGGIAKVGFLFRAAGNVWLGDPVYLMGMVGISVNVMLAVLNFIPFPPLDGGRILSSALPPRAAYRLSMIEPYSFWILIILIMTGVLFKIMIPFVVMLVYVIQSMFGLY